MKRLLSDLTKISFEAFKVRTLSNVLKTRAYAKDVGWAAEHSLDDKIHENAVVVAKFKIGPFRNIMA